MINSADNENRDIQRSDSFLCGMLLALSGGCMDAYSYLYRGEVFANAQTGNMLLFGVNLAKGKWSEAMLYFWPVLAFAVGIFLSDIIRHRAIKYTLHWRQCAVAIEIIILSVVCFIPLTYNLAANSLISFACGIQLESFRKIQGNAIATTMCIGNLRSGTHFLNEYFCSGDKAALKKAGLYFAVIVCFVAGAVVESILLKGFFEKAILLSVLLLAVVFGYLSALKPRHISE